MARGHASLADPESSRRVRPHAGASVDVTGQRVQATDRLYLAEELARFTTTVEDWIDSTEPARPTTPVCAPRSGARAEAPTPMSFEAEHSHCPDGRLAARHNHLHRVGPDRARRPAGAVLTVSARCSRKRRHRGDLRCRAVSRWTRSRWMPSPASNSWRVVRTAASSSRHTSEQLRDLVAFMGLEQVLLS